MFPAILKCSTKMSRTWNPSERYFCPRIAGESIMNGQFDRQSRSSPREPRRPVPAISGFSPSVSTNMVKRSSGSPVSSPRVFSPRAIHEQDEKGAGDRLLFLQQQIRACFPQVGIHGGQYSRCKESTKELLTVAQSYHDSGTTFDTHRFVAS